MLSAVALGEVLTLDLTKNRDDKHDSPLELKVGESFEVALGEVLTLDLTKNRDVKHDSPLELKVGESFEVLLREIPITGHIWQLIDADLEASGLASIIKNKGSTYQQDENREGAVGVGGVRKMSFEVIGAGAGDLNLYHGRSWEITPKLEAGEDLSAYIQKIISIVAKV